MERFNKTKTMNIELYNKLNNPIEAIDRVGEIFAKSGMFGCDRLEQGKVLAMICLAEQKSPVEITRDYHIVDGKLSKKALAALADFRRKGGKHKWIKTGDETPINEDAREAIGEFSFEGNSITQRFSIADAKKAGLIKPRSAWEKSPSNMLRARVISNAVAMLAPEIYAGDYDTEPTVESAPKVIVMPKPEPKTTITVTAPAEVSQPIEVKTEPVIEVPVESVKETIPAEINTEGYTISEQQAEEIAVKIGAENVVRAVAWLVRHGKITDAQAKSGEPFRFIPVPTANKIASEPERFVKALNNMPK